MLTQNDNRLLIDGSTIGLYVAVQKLCLPITLLTNLQMVQWDYFNMMTLYVHVRTKICFCASFVHSFFVQLFVV